MAFQTLLELDSAFAKPPFARIVSKLPYQPGGVDPLGLRQINLDLMDEVLPGINNVTSLIRPYVVMAWAWTKAAEVTHGRKEVSVDALLNIVERIETIFIWSHVLTGQSVGLPGRVVLGRALPSVNDRKAYSFFGKGWEKLRKDRRANTSLMSAVQYGPSIRTLEGIGWLAPADKGALVPVDDVMPAVKEFDAIVSQHLPAMLTNFDGGELTSKSAAKLHPIWSTGKPTRKEQKTFRESFFDRGKSAPATSREFRRYATLQLMLKVIGASKAPVDVETIRRMMFSARSPNNKLIAIEDELVPAHRSWIALQARQLQRIGLEALLVWIENRIDEADGIADAPSLSAEASRLATKDLRAAARTSVGALYSMILELGKPNGWPDAGGMGGKADVFLLIDRIIDAQVDKNYDQLPSLALNAIVIAAAITDALQRLGVGSGHNDLLGGPSDRLPLALALKTIRRMKDEPIETLWREIIERWVLGQHVRWSVARSGDETQRLRLAVDEGGWVRLRSKLSGPFRPTRDRLATALALSTNCGLLKRTKDREPRFTLP